jgi:hypothetical protein
MKIAESYIERMTYVQPRLDENNNPFRIVDHGRRVSSYPDLTARRPPQYD